MDIQEVIDLAARSGFVMELSSDEPSIGILPVGYMVVNMTTKDARGIRWSLAGSERDYKTTETMQGLITASYPESNTLSMQALHRLCSASL